MRLQFDCRRKHCENNAVTLLFKHAFVWHFLYTSIFFWTQSFTISLVCSRKMRLKCRPLWTSNHVLAWRKLIKIISCREKQIVLNWFLLQVPIKKDTGILFRFSLAHKIKYISRSWPLRSLTNRFSTLANLFLMKYPLKIDIPFRY